MYVYTYIHTCSPVPMEKFTYEYWLESSVNLYIYIYIYIRVYIHTCSPIPMEKFTYEYWLETTLERERDARERKQEVLARGGTWNDMWSCEEGEHVCVYVCVDVDRK